MDHIENPDEICDVVRHCENPAVDCIAGVFYYCDEHAEQAPAAYEAWLAASEAPQGEELDGWSASWAVKA